MAMLTLPQKYLKQPQGSVELAPRYRDALFFSMLRTLSDKDIAKNNAMTPNSGSSPSQSVRTWGKTLTFNGAGNNLKTASGLGAPTAFTVFAWVRPVATGAYLRICETDYSVGFYLGLDSTGTKYEFITAGDLGTCLGGTASVGSRAFVCATFASNTRSLYVNGVIVDTATSGGINSGYGTAPFVIGANAGNTNNSCWNGDIDTVGVFSRAFSASEIKTLYNEPWTMLKAPSRNLFFTASAPSSSSAGSAVGAATVSGTGASEAQATGSVSGQSAVSGSGGATASSAGSISGLSTVSGVGSAVIGSVGSASGVATVSGVGTSGTGSSGNASGNATVTGGGASTAASSGAVNGSASVSGIGASVASTTGTASGSATVSGVGDSSIPGATVGTASGTASVSGVGASIVSARGIASGSSSVSGVSESAEDSLGGDDGILIYEEPKKKKKPRRRIEDILEDAVRAVVIKADKQKPVAKPKPVKVAKVAEAKEVVLGPTPVDPVEQLRVAEEEAQKVSALLAQYQEQVRRREMEEDEELLMLIAMEML